MCKKQTSVSQFRIRNHLFGFRIEVRRYSHSWFLGSDRCSSWIHEAESKRTGGVTNVSNLEEWSMIWIMLIFPKTFSPQIKKPCCMCLKTMKQWLRHVSSTHRVALGYAIERIWTQNPIRTISHVMNRIIFCLFLTLAISVQPIVLKWCRKDSGEERIKAESKPMMNLVSRCSERAPETSSTASESPG